MATMRTSESVAVAATSAIHRGRLDDLRTLLADHPDLAAARFGDDEHDGMSRTLLHVATDWPGRFPQVATTIGVLVEAGAEVDGRFRGRHRETPLHWAASSNDVEALSAPLDFGADIDADGGVVAGSTPLADATAFAQWDAARVLVARGAHTRVFDLASLGRTDQVLDRLDASDPDSADEPLRLVGLPRREAHDRTSARWTGCGCRLDAELGARESAGHRCAWRRVRRDPLAAPPGRAHLR